MSINISYFAGAGAQFFDDNGVPLAGGLIYTYNAGTTTPVVTYTTITGTVNNTNPIVLDAAGRTPNEIWLDGGVLYKFVVKTSLGVTVGTYDNMPAVDDPTVVNNLITVTGTNTLLGTAEPSVTAYVAGAAYSFVAVADNTGPVTIDIDGVGARDILYDASTVLAAGSITTGKIITIEYDGTRFQYSNGLTSAQIPDGAVTFAKIQNISTGVVLGRTTASSGVIEQLTTLPAVNGSALTNLNASNLISGDVAKARLATNLNASGSAPFYVCRAWVNFNGAGTVAINGSGNVTSITDNGTGLYTVNLTTAMSNNNYSYAGTCGSPTSNTAGYVGLQNGVFPTTSALAITTLSDAGAVRDFSAISVMIVG